MVEEKKISSKSSYNNAAALVEEIEWLNKVVETRLKLYLQQPCGYNDITDIEPPDISSDDSVYAEFVRFYKLNTRERIVLMLTLLPHIAPQVLGNIFKNVDKDVNLSAELCGIKSTHFSGFLPSAETALFILAGNNLSFRF